MPAIIRVHEATVSSYIMPGGEVSELVREVSVNTRRFAIMHVNDRTGRLSANIRVNRPTPYGPYHTSALVYANIKHALWVHEGTYRIYPTHGKFLAVPKARGVLSGTELKAIHRAGGPKLYRMRRSVEGQQANPYLAKGLREAMRLL